MLLRNSLATVLAALTLLAGIAVSGDAQAGETVTIGTLAPKKSPWGKVFTVWAKAVKKKSKGELKLKWYFNGAQGDEKAMVDKMRAGQLDGAAVTSVGMSKIHKPMLAMQMPGLFTSWKSLDKARNAMASQFNKGMEKEGFMFLGTGDVGLARTMSKGKAIRTPKDLKGMKVYAWQDDVIAPKTASIIGYTPVLSSVPGLLPALSSGRINCITVPALAATQLQWWSHLDHVNDDVAGVGIGGLIIAKKRFDGLPGDSRKLLAKTGKKAGKMLTKKIRSEDKKAFKMLKKRMTLVKLDGAQKAKWKSMFKKIRKKLGQGTFSSALVKKLEGFSG
jgi:TRAP-type C4-dicarboxylate transport system substrate-binding protein